MSALSEAEEARIRELVLAIDLVRERGGTALEISELEAEIRKVKAGRQRAITGKVEEVR